MRNDAPSWCSALIGNQRTKTGHLLKETQQLRNDPEGNHNPADTHSNQLKLHLRVRVCGRARMRE